jgi:hypothetical protein
MVVLFIFSCSGDVEVSKTFSIHGSKSFCLKTTWNIWAMECSVTLKCTVGKQCIAWVIVSWSRVEH